MSQMSQFLAELGRLAPQLALEFLAARQGGPEAVGAFQRGLTEAQERQQALARQQQLDEERRAQQEAVNARAESAEARAAAAEGRAGEAADFQRRQALMSALATYEGDPSALAQFYQVPSEQVHPLIPMATNAREKRKAKEFITALSSDKRYAGYLDTAEGVEQLDNTSVMFQGRQVKVRDLRMMAEQPTLQARPVQAKPDVPNTPEEQFYATFAEEHGATWTKLSRTLKAKARREWMQADDRPAQQQEPLVQVTETDPVTGELITSLVPRRPGEVSRRPPAEPNQGQFTAATYATRMEQAEPILTAVESSITSMSLPAYELQTNSWFARPTFQSKDVQSYMQAARNFINAVLRRESGAVISPTEFYEARQQYLPQPGDTPEVLAQKAANRASVTGTMTRAAGRAYEPPVRPGTDTQRIGRFEIVDER